MPRLRLYDVRVSRLPSVIGVCIEDIQQIAAAVNSAEQRLLLCPESGDEGFFGTFAEMQFNVDPAIPYITTPREVARLEYMTVCNEVVPVQNQFYQYLQFGNGTLPKTCRRNDGCNIGQAYEKNNVVLFADPPTTPFLIRAYFANAADVGKRALIGGIDSNGQPIYSQDGLSPVSGQFMSFDSPFVTWPQSFNRIDGVQKDVTAGRITFYAVDATTGDETLILTMEPGEQTAGYRRYYLNPIPRNCCNSTSGVIAVKAIAKLEAIPVRVDTDYLLFHNLEAIIEECQSIRYSEIDSPTSKAMSHDHHRQAVRFLNGELTHRVGSKNAAIIFAPFGTAKLEYQNVGMM